MNTLFHLLPDTGATGISQTVAFPLEKKQNKTKQTLQFLHRFFQ